MHYDIDQVKKDVVGKWRGIYSSFGIDIPDSPKKHGACPICGPGNNSHRFRMDDKNGAGTWICTQCGAGDGWSLIQRALGLTFIEAIGRVSEIVGSVDLSPPEKEKKDKRPALIKLSQISKDLTGDDIVSNYLRSRGLIKSTKNLKFCPECYDSETRSTIPAMIAGIQDVDGKYICMHRTYLSNNGKANIKSPKKMMPNIKPLAGSAVRLFDVTDHVGIAEGIETAIAASQLFSIPVWACLSTTIMESFKPPAGIREIVIYGDNDINFAGQKSAYRLANRLYSQDFLVSVEIPETPGHDWNDEILTTKD